ncbi:MAG TPA: zinc ribbon domain-containing protein, partial [Acidobacteriota bacterium]|nr:zinc ribbon domain-containing protein [Acidobacteriota bacterium]
MLDKNSDNAQDHSEKTPSGSLRANLRRIVSSPSKQMYFQETTCQECNKRIAPDALFCESCHAPVVRRYCPKCSKLVPETSKLCPFCGAAANAPPRFHKNHIQTIVGVLAGI